MRGVKYIKITRQTFRGVILFQLQNELGGRAVSKGTGNLLYHVATRFKGRKERASMLVKYISLEKLTSELQLTGKHAHKWF